MSKADPTLHPNWEHPQSNTKQAACPAPRDTGSLELLQLPTPFL